MDALKGEFQVYFWYISILSLASLNFILFFVIIVFPISAIEYVTYLSNDRDRKNEEINEMEKKLVALKIVKE